MGDRVPGVVLTGGNVRRMAYGKVRIGGSARRRWCRLLRLAACFLLFKEQTMGLAQPGSLPRDAITAGGEAWPGDTPVRRHAADPPGRC